MTPDGSQQHSTPTINSLIIGNDERSFQTMVARGLSSGWLCRAYEWPEAIKVFREYRVGSAWCDVVAFHSDGSVTVIECKRAGLSLRDYMTGVGQLMHASFQIGFALSSQWVSRKVRLVLAVPSSADIEVGMACLEAGIEYMPCGTVKELNDAILGGDDA